MSISPEPLEPIRLLARGFDLAPNPTFFVSPGGQVICANRAARRMVPNPGGKALTDIVLDDRGNLDSFLKWASTSSSPLLRRLELPCGPVPFRIWRLPASHGLDEPILVLQADHAHELAGRFMQAQISAEVIKRKLDRKTSEHSRLTALARDLKHRSEHDALTGALNARAFAQDVRRQMGDGAGFGALVYIDLNGFKPVNDSFGHAAGDAILTHIVTGFKARLRPQDRLARLGGDEFGLWLDAVAPEDWPSVHDRLHAAASAPLWWQPGAGMHPCEISVTAAFGAAFFPFDGDGFAQLLALADTRMYAEKARRMAPRQEPERLAGTG